MQTSELFLTNEASVLILDGTRLKTGFNPQPPSALPLWRAWTELRMRPSASADRASTEWLMRRPRLLVIDDEPVLADFVAQVATECGFDPILTADDEDFRKAVRSKRPDMVALDLGMPGMDGVELLRFLAQENSTAPILIISGFDRRVLESAFRLGEALGLTMVGPLEKPVQFQDLERVLTELRSSFAE
jgi:CheY-like chemotaxis protein